MSASVPQLPAQFAKLARLFQSSTFPGEREAARRKAEAILPPEVGGFDRALRIEAYHAARAAAPGNFLAGWEEQQAIDDPEYPVRAAAARAERLAGWHAQRAGLVERYGSLEAVESPCEREKELREALKPWMVLCDSPYQRWTRELTGWNDIQLTSAMPADMRAAVEGAWPMPGTFADAQAELAYWRERNKELELALGHDGQYLGDYGLDRVCVARMEIIRDLVEHEMVLHTLPEILERFRIFRDRDSLKEEDLEGAIFRDLEAYVTAHSDPVLDQLNAGWASREEVMREHSADLNAALAAYAGSPAAGGDA